MKILFQVDKKTDKDDCPDYLKPNRDLFSAVLARGFYDYLLFLLYRNHKLKTKGTVYTEIKDVISWFDRDNFMSCRYYAENLGYDWDFILKYKKKIDKGQYNKEFLKSQIAYFNKYYLKEDLIFKIRQDNKG